MYPRTPRPASRNGQSFLVYLLRHPEEERHAARQLPHLPVLLQTGYVRALVRLGLELRRVDVLVEVASERLKLLYSHATINIGSTAPEERYNEVERGEKKNRGKEQKVGE